MGRSGIRPPFSADPAPKKLTGAEIPLLAENQRNLRRGSTISLNAAPETNITFRDMRD
jgi:hypothetical protein